MRVVLDTELVANFDPDQLRDEDGKWTTSPGSVDVNQLGDLSNSTEGLNVKLIPAGEVEWPSDATDAQKRLGGVFLKKAQGAESVSMDGDKMVLRYVGEDGSLIETTFSPKGQVSDSKFIQKAETPAPTPQTQTKAPTVVIEDGKETPASPAPAPASSPGSVDGVELPAGSTTKQKSAATTLTKRAEFDSVAEIYDAGSGHIGIHWLDSDYKVHETLIDADGKVTFERLVYTEDDS